MIESLCFSEYAISRGSGETLPCRLLYASVYLISPKTFSAPTVLTTKVPGQLPGNFYKFYINTMFLLLHDLQFPKLLYLFAFSSQNINIDSVYVPQKYQSVSSFNENLGTQLNTVTCKPYILISTRDCDMKSKHANAVLCHMYS